MAALARPRRPRRRGAAGLCAASLAIGLLLAACAAAPRPAQPVQRPEGSRPAPKPEAGVAALPKTPPVPPQSAYLKDALSAFSHATLPNGAELYVFRRPGDVAVARIALAPSDATRAAARTGLEALALELVVLGGSEEAPDAMRRALSAASARLELSLDGSYGAALELRCPSEALPSLLERVGASFADPAFRREDFESRRYDLQLEERREHSDRRFLASEELGAAYGDARGGQAALDRSPAGSADSLAKLRLEELQQYWRSECGGNRFRIVVVGDIDAARLLQRLSAPEGLGFGSLPRLAASAAPQPPLPARPAGFLVRGVPGSTGQALLRGEFALPPLETADFAALLVARSMFDRLLVRELRAAGDGWESRGTSLDGDLYGIGSIVVSGSGDPAAALGAVQRAIRSLASGRCVDLREPDGALQGVDSEIARYKARSLVEFYGGKGSAAALATAILRRVLRGSDATAFFRVGDRIASTKPEEVLRAAKAYLSDAALSWIALGDPALLAGLHEAPPAAAVRD